ncbi:MAG: tetratricopeptide repeat protein [Alistipes sp.]|jgi:tetratricopeptide (TPR) repeat protein|nr:tetratricopeptide repeat protein [Alistipes sp.]
MNRLKIALAAIAIVAAGTVAAQDLTSVNAKYAEAAAAIQAKNFAAAVPLFEQVISEGADIEGAEAMVTGAKQNLPVATYQMGGSAFQGGRLDEALASFTKAAEVAELYGNAAVLNNARTWIGRTVLRQGADAFNAKDYAAAAAIFQKGYEGNPNDTAVAMNLAMSYIGMGDYEKGNEIYRAVIALGGTDSRFAEAAAKASEQFTSDNLVRASEAAKAQDFDGAIAATDEIIASVPAAALAHLTRLQAYNSQKNYAKVIETGEAAAAAQTTDEDRSAVNFLVGAAYQNTEAYPAAIEAYRKVTAGPNAAAARAQITELQKVVK